MTMREVFLDELYKLALKDKDIVILSGDLGSASLNKIKELPNQFFNVGVAEENMIATATGLTLEGKKVFTYALMPFSTLRCYEFVKLDVSYMNLPITIIGVGAGFSYENTGETHYSIGDISIMRALPNFTILCPSDNIMAGKFAQIAHNPTYVRLDRAELPNIYKEGDDFSDGLTNLKDGEVYIISTGNMVHRALEVAGKIGAGVIDLYRIKPINEALLLNYIDEVNGIVTLEEHQLAGGLGSAIAEILVDNNIRIPLKRIGIHDKYCHVYGGRSNAQLSMGLDVDSIIKVITGWLNGDEGTHNR
jgi:transketolase